MDQTGRKQNVAVKSSITDERVARYVVEKIVMDSDVENDLRMETQALPNRGMISSSDVGRLLSVLAMAVKAKNAIEVGTFTGYTALMIAGVLPEGGSLICCDINAEWANVGRKYWQKAGLSEKIDLRLAPALETLNHLLSEGRQNSFDFAFIDADKTGYDSYYEACLKLLRPGGLIVLDNMLWNGAVADPAVTDETTRALRQLNEKVSCDGRVRSCLLTVGDGLMLAYKK